MNDVRWLAWLDGTKIYIAFAVQHNRAFLVVLVTKKVSATTSLGKARLCIIMSRGRNRLHVGCKVQHKELAPQRKLTFVGGRGYTAQY
jgi:hypothetical protein